MSSTDKVLKLRLIPLVRFSMLYDAHSVLVTCVTEAIPHLDIALSLCL
jgi:hypothetical protein